MPCRSADPANSRHRPRDRDRFDLDLELRESERAYFDDRVGRVRLPEPAPAQIDDLREVGHIGEEDRHLDDTVKTRTGRDQNTLEVTERLLGLSIEVTDADHRPGVVDRRLA